MRTLTRREALKKGSRLLWGTAACSICPPLLSGCSDQASDWNVGADGMKAADEADIGSIKLTVIYDNVAHRKGLQTDWGFACLVQGLDTTILFDSGRYDDLLMSNLSKLQIDPHQIDELFISHDHPDHIGGTLKLVEIQNNINVTLVSSFPWGFKKAVKKYHAGIKEIDQPQMVSGTCLSTGEMKSWVKNEHALVIPTNNGSIILTGCAHPGVVEIVERAKAITHQEVALVAGGFHLLRDDGPSIRKKAARLRDLGVRHVAPSHCSGGEARDIFAEVYGDRFLESGVGRTITANDIT